MRINSVLPNVSFKRSLTSDEVKEYTSVLKEGKQLVGQTGKSILIMPSACLPQSKEFNSGIGHLSSDISQNYLNYMKTYLGINVVEDLPAGQIPNNSRYYCAYKGSALALGNHQINPELLTTEEFGKILSLEDIQEIAKSNTMATKNELANFHNVMDYHGTQNKVLQKAYENFKKLPETSKLKTDFTQYIQENNEWLNFTRQNEPNQDFFKFKQFLADTHLKIGKTKLNQQGIQLCGDCLIGFSKDEVKAFPNAFIQDARIGANDWHAPVLNYDNILNPKSDAYKLLKLKVQLFAKRYDIIRFDAAWLYVTPPIQTKAGVQHKELGSSILNQMETWVKEVKGKDFDLKNIIYEFAANPEDFEGFKNGELIEPLKNRVKIYTSQYMHESNGTSWGFNKAYTDRKWAPAEYILGVGNHDSQPLRQIAKGVSDEIHRGVFENHKPSAIPVLAKELNLSPQSLENPINFAKAKWAEPMQSFNNMMFYWDVLGKEERFDTHWQKDYSSSAHRNYALKVPTNYQEAYQKGIQEGFGFNPMDSLEKLFIKKGFDKTHPDLFNKIVKFKNILTAPQEIHPPKSNTWKPILITAIGALGIGAIIKYFLHKPNKNNSLTPTTSTQPKIIHPTYKFYSFEEFIKK